MGRGCLPTVQGMRHVPAVVGALATALALAACSATTTTGAGPSASATSTPDYVDLDALGPGVLGLPYGEIPPVPMFQVPDVSVVNAVQHKVPDAVNAQFDQLATIPGVQLSSAPCGTSTTDDGSASDDGSGTVDTIDSIASDDGDGSGVYDDIDMHFENNGDGSGYYDDIDVHIEINADGTGYYDDIDKHVELQGDGSGYYDGIDMHITVDGAGAGSYDDINMHIENNGDGSGYYDDIDIHIENNGDGSGTIDSIDHDVVNNGDGTGTIDGELVAMRPMEPLPPVGRAGLFPTIDQLDPARPVCGVVMTLSDGVLFDFGSYDLRPQAEQTIDRVADAISASELAGTVQVAGHTDSISDDAFNQTLSENRAQAVADALSAGGVTNEMNIVGYGESRPVAPNEIDGHDNPAGRQLNRRVEVVLPFG
jgi:OmpA-OmpF porin, OOP family